MQTVSVMKYFLIFLVKGNGEERGRRGGGEGERGRRGGEGERKLKCMIGEERLLYVTPTILKLKQSDCWYASSFLFVSLHHLLHFSLVFSLLFCSYIYK